MRAQGFGGLISRWPPFETALRQSFRGQPEPLAVVSQQLYRRAPPAAEDKQTAGERIRIEFLAAELRQRIDAFIDWAWNYFGKTSDRQILDRSDACRINWEEEVKK